MFEFEIILIPFEILLVSYSIMLFQEYEELYRPYKRLIKNNIFILCNNWEIVPVEGKEKYFYIEIDFIDENLKKYHFESEPLKNHEYIINPKDFIRVYVDIKKNPKLYIIDMKDKLRR